jgi:LPS sulfotransferase NodH
MSHVLARRKLIFAYLEEIVDMQGDVDAFGFKLMYGQARRYPELVDWCKDHQVRVVHLVRRNTLKMIVSREIAKRRGVYLSTRSLKPVKVMLKTKGLVLELERLESIVDKYRKAFSSNCCLDVEYEQLISNCDGETNRILDFLGIEPNGSLRSKLVKTSSDSLMELVENYQHVCAALRGSPYELLLD